MDDLKWDIRFLRLAREISAWSKDPSTKVGAVIVRPDRTIVSLGYNGFPRGTDDAPHLYADRDFKYRKVVHAEQNALLNARTDVTGCTLYTWPPGYGATCERCAAHVIQAGIARVVSVLKPDDGDPFASRWREACELATSWYGEAGVRVDMLEPSVERLVSTYA